MEYKYIIVQDKNGIGRITFNKPPLNVLDIAMMEEINNALKEFQGRSLKILVLNATGKAFSAGVDVSDHTPDKVERMIHIFHDIFNNLMKIKSPTIAIVNGAALGGGCEIVLFCDIVIASEKSKFGQPEIKVGVFPPVAAAILPRLIHSKKAIELILTGDTISAADAKMFGFVNHVMPVDNFEIESEKFITEKIACNSAAVLQMTKKAFNEGVSHNYPEAIKKIEDIYLNELMKTNDAKEGLKAFLEKRPPVWTDE